MSILKNNILLALSFAKRDLKQRYIGTGLGQLWYILSPLVMILIYTVIFSDFMKMKLNVVDSAYSYSIYLISGLLAWTAFSTLISRLSTSIEEKVNLIKKINVPVYVFGLSIMFTELFLFFISISLSIIFLLIVSHPVTITFLWLIPIMILQTIFAFSLGMIFALFTPFVKDLKEIIPIVIQLWFWMTPIIYLASMIENKYPALLIYNPFYKFVSIYQDIFLYSKAPELSSVVTIVIMVFALLVLSGYLYKKMISTIKDII